jgi:rhodanese-related sulfurtransferase
MERRPRLGDQPALRRPGEEGRELICRSGHRSVDAGLALEQAGFKEVYNVLEGFEGPLDDDHHRGSLSGWRKEGLPWEQL